MFRFTLVERESFSDWWNQLKNLIDVVGKSFQALVSPTAKVKIEEVLNSLRNESDALNREGLKGIPLYRFETCFEMCFFSAQKWRHPLMNLPGTPHTGTAWTQR
jgi:hypothetical protein